MRVLITGVNGFVGQHLARELREHGCIVIGCAREDSAGEFVRDLLHSYVKCDFLDPSSTEALSEVKVDTIIHLAGLSSVGQSFEMPREYMIQNGEMVYNLLSSFQKRGFNGRTLIISTGALYASDQPMPLSESAQTTQGSPYAVGKLFAENTAAYFVSRGMDVVIARPFNHIGPNQAAGFLLPDLYAQILSVQNGKTSSISVGNLNTERDYTDVRDIVKAYFALISAQELQHRLYNICSGKSLSGKTILSELQNATNTLNINVDVDQSRFRPNDTQLIVGDSKRISTELNWHPSIPITQTIKDFVATSGK